MVEPKSSGKKNMVITKKNKPTFCSHIAAEKGENSYELI